MIPRHQVPFRFTAEPDPRYCARAFCRVPRRFRATHRVTIAGKAFNVCGTCARKWESASGATVEKLP